MGALPHMLSSKRARRYKNISFQRKGIGIKIVMRTELCMTKNITYIYTYKTGLNILIK